MAPPEHASRARVGLAFLFFVALGLGLRVAVALHAAHAAHAWEADGFLRCWEALDFVPAARLRPPLPGWLMHALAEALSAQSILAVRLQSVGLSLVGLLGAVVLARVLGARLGHRQPDHGAALAWIAGCWAVLPTLAASAASPLGDALLGGLLCLAAAAAVQLGSRPGVLATAWLALALLGALLTGGIGIAAVALLALLVFLAPVPPLRTALGPVLAVVLALAAGWWLQRGPDPERRWMPDAAPAWSLAALTETPLVTDEREPLDPDRRALGVWQAAVQQARQGGPLRLLRQCSVRLVGDLLHPARFDHALALPRPLWPLGLLDLLLRGGLLLFAVAATSMAQPRMESALPRGALIAGVVLLLLVLLLTASSPFALVPLDTLLLGAAGAGVACADRRHGALRWFAFAVGGLLLAGLGAGALVRGEALSPWITSLQTASEQGPQLVRTLADGGPQSTAGEVFAAQLLMDRSAPFLRTPEAALRHALRAVERAPDSEAVVTTLVHAHLENLDFVAALRLADSLRGADGGLTPGGRVLRRWVEESERSWRSMELQPSSG